MRKSSAPVCPTSCDVHLPAWVRDTSPAGVMADDEACMALVLNLAERNVKEETGGPFGALVLDSETRRVLALGVNLAPTSGNAVLHAETVALMLAAQIDEADEAKGKRTLYASCAPCIMCLGAAHWAGVERIVCGALKEDAEAVGFNEGEGTAELAASMKARGVKFRSGVMRDRAARILRGYCEGGGDVYGPGWK